MHSILYNYSIFQGIVYIDKDVLGWKPIADAWLESRSPQEIHVSFTLQMLPKVKHFIIFSSVSNFMHKTAAFQYILL